MIVRCLSAIALAAVAFSSSASAADVKTKRLLLVTDSGGFIHDSVGVAEDVLKEIGPKNGFIVTCYRFTREPNEAVFSKYSEEFRKRTGLNVEKENCGRVNKETLKNFDIVLFFTTGNPLNKEELAELQEWVKAGGAFAGTHCASDTLYNTTYGDLVGGYFVNHPWHQKIKINVEDSKHAAAAGFKTGDEITDEIYQFRDTPYSKTDPSTPYSREKLHIIMSVDNSSIDTNKKDVVRKDKDFAISWCQEYGKGRSFYTSLGHRREVWKDERFQQHLLGGLKWAVKQAEGSAAPSGAKQ